MDKQIVVYLYNGFIHSNKMKKHYHAAILINFTNTILNKINRMKNIDHNTSYMDF